MFAARLFLLLALLPLCSFFPGFFLVRRLRWSPLEKLGAAVGSSLILLYLAAFAIYAGGLPWRTAAWAVAAVCLTLGLVVRRDAARLVGSPQVRNVVLGYLFLLGWMFTILAMIRHYSGGGWVGDWLEHFNRTVFFLDGFPRDSMAFPGPYPMPARPPLMNLVAALFLAQAGEQFELFQVAFTFLNLLVFLPCCLIAPALARGVRRPVVLLMALFALSPIIVQNATYTWTKLFAAFYVVLGLCCYLAGWRKNEHARMLAGFLFLAAGTLVHYSAGPYVVAVTLHYLLVVFRRRPERWREMASIVAVSGALLATWFGWSIAVHGAKQTFAANSTLSAIETLPEPKLRTFVEIRAENLYRSIVPHPLRRGPLMNFVAETSIPGWLREYFFLIYQPNAVFAMGMAGGPLVLYLLYRVLWRERHTGRRQPQRFWLILIPCGLLLGTAAHPGAEVFGVAHVTLLTLLVLGLSLLAGSLPFLSRAARGAIVIGCVLDFSLGVFLQARMQHLENGPERTVFARFALMPGHAAIEAPHPRLLSRFAWENWFRKHQFAACRAWMEAPEAQLNPLAHTALERCLWEDHAYWRGWYEHHGGALVFLGDHAAGSSLPTVALVVLFLGLLSVLYRQLLC
jgi:hypothetical protein